MVISYCNEDPLGTPEVTYCPKYDKVGGMSSVIFLETGHGVTDPSSASQINAAKAAQKAHQIDRVSMSVEGASAVESDSLVPCEPANVVNYDRKGIYINPNVTVANIGFHDNLFDGRVFAGAIVAECGKDGVITEVSWINHKMTLRGSLLIPAKNTEYQRFEGEWKGRSMNNPSKHAVPVGIFS